MKHCLIGEDDHSYHVHDGKKNFLVAKKGLKEDLHAKIKGLPKYAEGGVVEKPIGEQFGEELVGSQKKYIIDPLASVLGKASDVADQVTAPVGEFAKDVLTGAGVIEKPVTPGPELASVEEVTAPVEPVAAPAIAPAPAIPAGPNFYAQMQANNQKQVQGIQEAANIQSKLAEDQAKVLEEQQNPEFEAQLKGRMQELEGERVKVKQDLDAFRTAGAEDKVDPNRVWNNMSTGNKILATIGLILGGAGGGASGNNAALNVLNQAIDRDVNAQKANIDKKQSLYRLNLERYKDTVTAQEMTRMQLNSLTQGKIAALAARSNSDLAKANAKQMIGQLENQNLQIGQALYEQQKQSQIRNTILNNAGKVPTEQAINYLVPEHDRKAAREELEMVNGYKNAVKGVAQVFQGIKDIGASGTIPYTNASTKLDNAAAEIESVIRQSMKGQGSISDRDMENIKKLVPKGIDRDSQRKAKMDSIVNILKNKVAGGTPTLSGYKIPLDMTVSTLAPDQEKIANWAKQTLAKDPNNRKAKEVMSRLGG